MMNSLSPQSRHLNVHFTSLHSLFSTASFLVLFQFKDFAVLYYIAKVFENENLLLSLHKDKSSTHRLCKQSKTRQFFLVEFSHIPPHIRNAGVKRVNSCPNFLKTIIEISFYADFLFLGQKLTLLTPTFDPYYYTYYFTTIYYLFYYYLKYQKY